MSVSSSHASTVCSECGWTNVSLLNMGEPGRPRMVCHGCLKRALEAVDAYRASVKPNAGVAGTELAKRPESGCSPLRESLAEYAHVAWAGWMQYLFGKSTRNADGTVTIPAWAVERWTRQAETEYADLPENEKDSDRKEADSMIGIMTNESMKCDK